MCRDWQLVMDRETYRHSDGRSSSSIVGSIIAHETRIEDYLHSDVMNPQGFALELS